MSVKYYLFQCRKTLFILRSVVIYFPRRKCINKYKYKHIYCENYVSILCPAIVHISHQYAAHTYNNKITHCQYFHLVTLTSHLCITNHQIFSIMTKHILLYLNIGMQNYILYSIRQYSCYKPSSPTFSYKILWNLYNWIYIATPYGVHRTFITLAAMNYVLVLVSCVVPNYFVRVGSIPMCHHPCQVYLADILCIQLYFQLYLYNNYVYNTVYRNP